MVLINQNQSALFFSGLEGKMQHYENQCIKREVSPLLLSLKKLPADSSGSWIC